MSVLLLLHFLVSCSPRRVQPSLGPGLVCWQSTSPACVCVCVCVCHFEGGGDLTVIKVKRPTVLVRGRGEKEGERGKREMDR